MDIMQEAAALEKQGRSIIHMEVGQPNSGATKEALTQLYNQSLYDKMGYSVALGIPELRKEIVGLYKQRYNLTISPERVIVTSGSSAAFILAFTAFFEAGDTVLIGEPSYPSYKNIIKSLDLNSESHQTMFEDRFQLTADTVLKSNAEGILIASPANPTGSSLIGDDLRSLVKSAKQKNMVFISDEIYHGLNFSGRDSCALEFDDEAVVINSFSKYYCLTGWRLGWMIVPPSSIRTIEKLAQNLFICPSYASQLLGSFTLNSLTNFDLHVHEYRKNRDMLIRSLPELGFNNVVKPDGAFYIYAGITQFNSDSISLVRKILNETGVAITPGNDFDSLRGHETVRFSFACSNLDVKEAIRRLASWSKDVFC